MKHISYLLMLAAALTACSKKDNKTASTTPATPVTPAPHQVSAKVNDTLSYCDVCFSSSASGGLRGVRFSLSGSRQVYFSCTNLPAPGTYTLSKTSEPSMVLIDNNQNFAGVVGSLTLTAIDTSQGGAVKTITGSFNFITDTISSKSFTVTEGSMYVKN